MIEDKRKNEKKKSIGGRRMLKNKNKEKRREG
jgi:hypothetical protein